ncbi:MAG TPA: FemAB family XrtA/PEP-CTERM system-associated protein [Terriglobia bacterium]|nr:FemAB family XrtA/PEP-CTERM system-associated protein [Terriglobia bacterium]
MNTELSAGAAVKAELCEDPARWDAYVESSAGATNYHRWVWGQVIADTFGHRPYRLAATAEGAVQGVLPLSFIESRLFGRFLVSVPFFSYGGVLASTPEAGEALLKTAIELGKELGARHIELRSECADDAGWHDVSSKVGMLVDLPSTVEELWQSLSTGMRNKVRSARKRGLRAEWGGAELVDVFYRIFSTNMRNLGTPVYPRRWFENICHALPAENRVVVLWDNQEPVAAGIVTAFRGTVDWPWSATMPDSHRKYSAILLYWSLLEWALEKGYRQVDLGRCTPGSGTWEFKRHWPCEEKALHWRYWLAPGVPIPQVRPDNPRYHWAIKLWRRLPLAVANRLGPYIASSIP